MIKEIKPPHFLPHADCDLSIFLAGTIEMGKSEDWQFDAVQVINSVYGDERNLKMNIYNPRRDNFNPDWKQEFEDPHFSQQVNWELDALEKATFIVFNFLPESRSPITLHELGLFARSGKCWVCCPKEFWRSGNVEITCNRFNIPLYRNMEELLNELL